MTHRGRVAPAILLLLAAATLRADPTADALRAAANLARQGAYDDAVRALPPLDGLAKTHWRDLQTAAQALQSERPAAATQIYCAMRRIDPHATEPRSALEAVWSRVPVPGTLPAVDLALLPVVAQTTRLPGGARWTEASVTTMAPAAYLAVPPATEPHTGETFERLLGVYVGGALRFTVHSTRATPETRTGQIGRFLGALAAASDQVLGRRSGRPMDVWLFAGGKPGAEQWAEAIRIHATGADRSDLEWARELAHEWGHATIPGVDGFREPEAWANGDLGERLFLPALAERGWLSAWSPALDATAYVKRYVTPLCAAFARTGPVPALVRSRSKAGYDHFLGAALYVAAAYGSPILREALADMDEATTAGFLSAFRRRLATRQTWTVDAPEDTVGPRALCFPSAGSYTFHDLPAGTTHTEAVPAGWVVRSWKGRLCVQRVARGGVSDGSAVQVSTPGAH